MKLSDKIIKLRKAKGWSQEELAEKLNVSRQAVSRWENGTALPDANNILQLSRLFQVSADYLLKEDLCDTEPVPAVTENAGEAVYQKKKEPKLHLVAASAFAIAAVIWLCLAIAQLKNAYGVLALVNAVLAGIQRYLYTRAVKKR